MLNHVCVFILVVLSTGYPVLSPDAAQICSTFPRLFPKQIDDNCDCHGCESVETNDINE